MQIDTAYKRERTLDTPPHRVFFDWEIVHSCPYKCEYCWFTRAGWDKFAPKDALPSFERTVAAWERMHELYGCCHINITGGEPSVFPRFFELAAKLSRQHTLEIQTNLSFDTDAFLSLVPPERVRLAATFHPARESAEVFIFKAKKLHRAGFEIYCNFLAHPSQLAQLPGLRKQFRQAGLPLYAQRYDGPWEDALFPAAYREEELALIEDRPPRPVLKAMPTATPPQDKPAARPLCRMGQMYAKILPDGRTYRCRTVAYEKDVKPPFFLGNLFKDEAFELLPEALPCTLDCRCEPMLEGAEQAWLARAKENRQAAVSFGWDLCYECNYRCPYCQGWDRQKKAVGRTLEQWREIWERIYLLYGCCHIYVSGGEPSIHPDFTALMLQTAKLHEMDICTNLSWDPQTLTSKLSPRRLSISATFHPDFADFEEFLAKAVKAKDYLAHGKVYTVASPRHMHRLEERAQALAKHGIRLQVMPLRGVETSPPPCTPDEQPSAQEPQPGEAEAKLRVLNDETEKEVIKRLAPAPGREQGFRLGEKSPKGRNCRAGFRYAIIRASGRVDRCSQCQTGELGDISDPGFRLFTAPKPCERDFCPIESDWLE